MSWLYEKAVRPLLFCRDPEDVHNAAVALSERVGRNALARNLARRLWSYADPRLRQLSELARGPRFSR